ncbi:hypothetical protein OAV62_00500 [bacterium]|nr:hypothetical protein [bacterium]
MVRKKLAVMVAALGALQTGAVSALGISELSLQSALNQPLQGEIRLMDVGDLDESQIKISLASTDDFKRAGVEKDFFLTNLKFKVAIDEQGNGVIHVTTRDSIVEPYLNFLVEARWPTGRILREYTVLLDLPVFSDSEGAAVQVPSQSALSAQKTAPAPVKTASSVPAMTNSARQSLSEGQISPGEKYRVQQNETLWEIAKKARPSDDVTVQQTIVAIQSNNPTAFIKGNVNRLKAGYVLRMPTTEEAQATTNTEAVREIARQNRAWRSGGSTAPRTDAAQIDATASSISKRADTKPQARLSISSDGDSGAAGSDGDGGVEGGDLALRNKLSATEENLDKSERDGEELKSRLNDVEERLATVQRLLELKEAEMADLQAKMADEQVSEVGSAQNKPVVEPKAKPKVEPETPVVAEVVKPKVKPKPEPTLVEQLMENPLYQGGAGLLLLALIGVALLKRRKSDDDFVEAEEVNIEPSMAAVPDVEEHHDEPEIDVVEESLDVSDELELDESEFEIDELETVETLGEPENIVEEAVIEEAIEFSVDDAAVEAASDEVPAPISTETGDAVAEADIYIAYGRYQQAIDLLSGAIDSEPARGDLHAKLLSVYIETRDKEAFQQQYAKLLELSDEQALVQVKESLSAVEGVSDWLDISNLGSVSDADNSVDEGFDLDLDLDDDSDLSDLTAEIESDELSLDEDLDLDLSALDTAEDEETEAEITLNLGDEELQEQEIELDLDAADEDLDLDLDLDLDTDLDLSGADEVSPEKIDIDLDDMASGLNDDNVVSFEQLGDVSEVEVGTPDVDVTTESVDLAADSVDATPGFEAAPESDDELDFLADGDEVATKLDLARAYIDMGDVEGAKDIIGEVIQDGTSEQKEEAASLLELIE